MKALYRSSIVAGLCIAFYSTATALTHASDGRLTFSEAQQLYARQSSFKAHAHVTGRGRDVSYDVEARKPDTYHIKMQHGIEGIVKGSRFFMRAGNSWMRAPMDAPPIVLFPDRRVLGVTNVRTIEPDHFAFDSMGTSSCELWLSHGSHLPQTLKCHSPGADSNVDYYDWNQPVSFEVPQQ